jgi:hypothetical protein
MVTWRLQSGGVVLSCIGGYADGFWLAQRGQSRNLHSECGCVDIAATSTGTGEIHLAGAQQPRSRFEAWSMSRRDHAASIRLATTGSNRRSSPASASTTRTQAAVEISDVLVALRQRAQENDLKFLSYLLEMAFLEAFEQSQKADRVK